LAVSGHEAISNGGFLEVETISLDDFFSDIYNKIDFIKIDAEGAEGLIINGAHKILKKDNLKILMEFWPDAIRRSGLDPMELLVRLKNYGFKIYFINNRRSVLEPFEAKMMASGAGFNLFLEK